MMFNNKRTTELFQNPSSFFPSKVKNILLNNNSNLFNKNNGWSGLGTIQFEPIYNPTQNDTLYFAKPLFSNIKQYPLKNEIVLIISLPSPKQNNNVNSSEYYYLNLPISFWNSINHNSFNNDDDTFGDTFEESNNANPLLPEEGDIIIQGRFGNAIRFSSSTPTKQYNNNAWSSNPSSSNSPITIISNNHKKIKNPWVPIQEDINEDGSSIWLCSDQEIPINYACNNLKTFNKTLSDSFDITLNIPDSQI